MSQEKPKYSFDDLLKDAAAVAAKQPEPDPAVVAAEQAEKEKERYTFTVIVMVKHAVEPSFAKIAKQMLDKGVYCYTSGGSDEEWFVFERLDNTNTTKEAAIGYRIESDGGVTITATKEHHNQAVCVKIAKFSPSDVREMVNRMGDIQKAKAQDPDSDHPLTQAIRNALAYVTTV